MSDWDQIFSSEQMQAVLDFNREYSNNPNAKAVGFVKDSAEDNDEYRIIIATLDHDTRIEIKSKYGNSYKGFEIQFDVLGASPATEEMSILRNVMRWLSLGKRADS